MGGKVIIGTSEREFKDIEPNWINDQINRRKEDGVPVCVRIHISQGDVDINLSTPDCERGPGRTRALTRAENEVVDLWNRLHLNEKNFSSGNLVAFLKQLGV